MANSKVILLSRAMIKVSNTNNKATSNTHLKSKASLHLADKTLSVLPNKVAFSTANNHINSAHTMLATHKATRATMVSPSSSNNNNNNNNMAAATPTLKTKLISSNSAKAIKANKVKACPQIMNSLASPLSPMPPTTTRMLLP